jgi:hypothetical protein
MTNYVIVIAAKSCILRIVSKPRPKSGTGVQRQRRIGLLDWSLYSDFGGRMKCALATLQHPHL